MAPEGIGDAVIKKAEEIVARHEPHVRFRLDDQGHDQGHDEIDESENGLFGIPVLKLHLARIIVSVILFALSFLISKDIAQWLLLAAYILSGYEIVGAAVRNLTRGLVFDENFLMTLATVGAVAIGEYQEAVGVMLFYMIGEYFQDLAVHRSRRSIKELLNIRPDYATLLKDGQAIRVEPEAVSPGDLILVRPGERVPLDAVVIEGYSQLDTRALTGESIPREASGGDEVLSGVVNLTSTLTLRATKPYGESTVSRIMELVENSAHQKGKTEKFITKFARIYTPVVVALASIVAFVVPLLLQEPFSPWIRKGLVFLVISCPCALVISIPLGFFGGLGLASRNGILIKGSNFLEELKNVKTVVLDKTGTITQGTFRVTQITPAWGITQEEVLSQAALAEVDSPHPIAKSILEKLESIPDRSHIRASEEIRGKGLKATLTDGSVIYAGNGRLMQDLDIKVDSPAGTMVYVVRETALGRQYLGSILIADEIKDHSRQAIADLRQLGVERIVMLSGDNHRIVEAIAHQAGITEFQAELLPQDKVAAVQSLTKDQANGQFTAFAGDGLNDTPVLKMADIGISMGSIGSSAAIEASDVVLMDDSLVKIPLAMNISRMTGRIVIQNIILALGIKFIVMVQSIFFAENIWLAIFADVGVALLAVLNSSRLSRMDPSYRIGGTNRPVQAQVQALDQI